MSISLSLESENVVRIVFPPHSISRERVRWLVSVQRWLRDGGIAYEYGRQSIWEDADNNVIYRFIFENSDDAVLFMCLVS